MCVNPNNSIFYVYVYLDPRKPGYYVFGNYIFDHEPFYVGKGCNGRAYEHLQGCNHNKHFHRKINKIRKEWNSDPIIIKMHEMITEDNAFELEKELICVIGRWDKKLGTLCNLTDGGEGPSGHIHSKESRKKMSEKLKGHIVSEETKHIMRLSHGTTNELLENAKTLINEGVGITKIEKILNTTHTTLYKYLKKEMKEYQKKIQTERMNNKLIKPLKYRMTYPNGTIVEIPNLKQFCRENGLTRQGLEYAKSVGKPCKGFYWEKI